MKSKSGFSLIELLIVIAILGVLAIAGVSNYMSSLQRSRDARRKADLSNIQKALESYYNDYGFYPASTAASNLCDPAYPNNCYLKTTPSDPSGYTYYYLRGDTSGTNQSFELYSALERTDDAGTGTGSYGSNCGTTCRYGVSSTNTTPSVH